MSEPMVTVECQPCMFCGQRGEVTLPVRAAKAWNGGALLQEAWPEGTPGERELLISGVHPDCWEKYMKDEEED